MENKNITNIQDKYKKEYDELTQKMRNLGVEMGWMTENDDDPEGMFGPLLREMYGEASETEIQKIHRAPDATKAYEFYKMFGEWEELRKKVEAISNTHLPI